METKKAIREKYLGIRRQMPEEIRREKSRMITEKILSHPWYRNEKWIYCYVSLDDEVSTRKIIETAWKAGKRVAVPGVDGKVMDFFEITSFHDLTQGTFGIMEPVGGYPAEGREGLVIVPGVVFDTRPNRIGYGRGYYDRYLMGHTGLKTLAAAFDCQVAQGGIPADRHDIRPMVLITERRTIVRSDECR